MKRIVTITCALALVALAALGQETITITKKVSVEPEALVEAMNDALNKSGKRDQVQLNARPDLESIEITSEAKAVEEITKLLDQLEAGVVPIGISRNVEPVIWLYDLDSPDGGATRKQEFHNVDVRTLGDHLRVLIAQQLADHGRAPIRVAKVTDDYIVFSGDSGEIDEVVDVLARLDEGDPVEEHADDEQLEPIRKLFERGSNRSIDAVFYPQTVTTTQLEHAFQLAEETWDLPVRITGMDSEYVMLSGAEREVNHLIEGLKWLDEGDTVPLKEFKMYTTVIELFAHAQNPVNRIIKLKNGVTREVHELVGLMSGGRNSNELRIDLSESLGWVRLQGPSRLILEFEQLLAEVDVALVNVELTFYLLVMSSEEQSSIGEYPKSIDAAVSKIRETFGLNSLTVLDILQLRSSEGNRMSLESSLPLSKVGNEDEQFYAAAVEIGVSRYSISEDQGQSIFDLDDVEVQVMLEKEVVHEVGAESINGGTVRRTVERRSVGAEMQSSLDIREGQSVVLGKSNFDNSDRALFVIVQARRAD